MYIHKKFISTCKICTLIFTHLERSHRDKYPTQQVKLRLLVTVKAKVSMTVVYVM